MKSFSRAFTLFSVLITLFSSCGNEDKAPHDTLSEEKMAVVLSEIHVAESRATRLQLKSTDSSQMIFNKLKEAIWKNQKVDSAVYRRSYEYYMSHPERMSRIYEKVQKKIEDREKKKNIKL